MARPTFAKGSFPPASLTASPHGSLCLSSQNLFWNLPDAYSTRVPDPKDSFPHFTKQGVVKTTKCRSVRGKVSVMTGETFCGIIHF